MVDKNNVPLKDGDSIDITCPFCGWTDGVGRFDEDVPKTWRKCVWCKKKYRPRSSDISSEIGLRLTYPKKSHY